jgi:hypothetical protein
LWALISFFSIFYNSMFTTTLSLFFFQNSRNGKNTSLVLFLSLKNMGILPKFYKSVCSYFISQTSLCYGQPLNANQPKRISRICACMISQSQYLS